MTDYLDRLIQRVSGRLPTVKPVVRSSNSTLPLINETQSEFEDTVTFTETSPQAAANIQPSSQNFNFSPDMVNRKNPDNSTKSETNKQAENVVKQQPETDTNVIRRKTANHPLGGNSQPKENLSPAETLIRPSEIPKTAQSTGPNRVVQEDLINREQSIGADITPVPGSTRSQNQNKSQVSGRLASYDGNGRTGSQQPSALIDKKISQQITADSNIKPESTNKNRQNRVMQNEKSDVISSGAASQVTLTDKKLSQQLPPESNIKPDVTSIKRQNSLEANEMTNPVSSNTESQATGTPQKPVMAYSAEGAEKAARQNLVNHPYQPEQAALRPNVKTWPAQSGERASLRNDITPTTNIRVTIGRVEIKAINPPPPQTNQTKDIAKPKEPAVSLAAYLKGRDEERP